MTLSKMVFEAIEAGDWNNVNELIATTNWTPQDLEEKHGVITRSHIYDEFDKF